MRFRRRKTGQATVREAIEYLASACDGAVRRDGHGFNREHVRAGHRLAHKPRWSRRDRKNARALARLYGVQLEQAGILHPRTNRHGSPAWVIDPTGVHQLRYWSGDRWTSHVA